MEPLIGQTIVVNGGKNRLTYQDRNSPVRDSFYLTEEYITVRM